ncbi:MAG: signal peptidase I [Mycobacteriales bacterium]
MADDPDDARPPDAEESARSEHSAPSSADQTRQPADDADGSEDGADPGQAGRRGRRRRRSLPFWQELPILIVVAFVLALLVKTFLLQAFFIPSASMEKTLHGCPGCSGDRVLVNKLVYRLHDPRPGDIVVFRGPPNWQPEVTQVVPGNAVARALQGIGRAIGVAQPSDKDFIKRVIAVGGQSVSCCDAEGRVMVDGRSLTEPYIYQNSPLGDGQCTAGRSFGPVTVPNGRLWVMGDHRGDSSDSRCHTDEFQGTVGVNDVIGKAIVVAWPPSRWRTLGTPATFKGDAGAFVPNIPVLMGALGGSLGLVVPLTGLAGLATWRRRRGAQALVSPRWRSR